MWACENCRASGFVSGYRASVTGIETHLRSVECKAGWYWYGGKDADRTCIQVTRGPDGRLVHRPLTIE